MPRCFDRDVYTYTELEGAVCAWEYLLGRSNEGPLFEGHGYAAKRGCATHKLAVKVITKTWHLPEANVFADCRHVPACEQPIPSKSSSQRAEAHPASVVYS